MDEAPGPDSTISLRLYFDIINNGKSEKILTDFHTGIKNVTEEEAKPEESSTPSFPHYSLKELKTGLKVALASKLSEVLKFKKQNRELLEKQTFLVQDLGKLPHTNGILAEADFQVIHDLYDNKGFILKAIFNKDNAEMFTVDFNMRLTKKGFELEETTLNEL